MVSAFISLKDRVKIDEWGKQWGKHFQQFTSFYQQRFIGVLDEIIYRQ